MIPKRLFLFVLPIFSILNLGCAETEIKESYQKAQFITILGTAQDAGYPHIGNPREYEDLKKGLIQSEKVVSLGLVDMENSRKYLFEATPDMPQQLDDLERSTFPSDQIIDGVFLTHAHIGHYTGLMYFGREALGANNIPVFAMPKMKSYLEENGPWSQLVELNNIELRLLKSDSTIQLSSALKVTPFLVPHRDEFSETVGYKIEGKSKSALFIPDINKWDIWDRSIVEEVKKVDYAFVDATFLKDGEIPRPMSEVPHPFIRETVELFKNESEAVKNKVIFIHFNHSNPAISAESPEIQDIIREGFRFARTGQKYPL